MTSKNRPLSPHLQVYRLPLTGMISITHRITGVFLALGLLLFVAVLLALAGGEDRYAALQCLMAGPLPKLLYWGFVYALFFHLCHGFRHLLWDIGATFEPATLFRYACYELFASVLLTAITFFSFQ